MLVILQEKLLSYTSLFYIIAVILYITFLGKRSEIIGKAATAIGLLGVAFHTSGLIVRWIAAGISHPPFTNLYESLVFFAWGIVIFYLYVEWRHKVKIAGAFVFPIALAAMGLAVTHQRDIMPLPDALKSWWLHIHVMFASIAYAAFVVAFAFSLMFLIKDKVSRSVFGLVVTALSAFCVVLVQTRAGISNITTFFMRTAEFHDGKWSSVMIPDTFPPEYHVKPIPLVGAILFAVAVMYILASIMFIVHLSRKNKITERLGGYLTTVGAILFLLSIILIVYQSWVTPDVTIRIESFLFALLAFLCLSSLGVVFLFYKGESFMERLPAADTLDFLGYRSVMVAFPLMTVVIVTGAVWAQSAWGRYWSWDPKETASLVTWIIYAVYLHTRIVAGWKGRPTAVIGIIGFLSVIFTYLGVNVFLSGLHSYAQSF